MLAQIIATIAYAGPRWLRENRLTVVYKSETRSPEPSSVATIAHHDAGHRLVARDDALEGARHDVALGHPAQPQTLLCARTAVQVTSVGSSVGSHLHCH